jgi:hypothetical protein
MGATPISCNQCHGDLATNKPDIAGNKLKINVAAGTAIDQGAPDVIRNAITAGKMPSTLTGADLADVAAYINAITYKKALINTSGVEVKLPFVLLNNGVAVSETDALVAMPNVMLGSASSIKTTLTLGPKAGGTLTVTGIALQITDPNVKPNALMLSNPTTQPQGGTVPSCLATPLTLTGSQTCTVDVVMATGSPGALKGDLIVTDNANGQTPVVVTGVVAAQADGGAGGGGCTMRSAPGLFDPVLMLLSVLSLGVLGLRRKKQPRV